MTRSHEGTWVNIPIQAAFDYATTPGNRPARHPSSLGATDHSLEPGDQVTEEYPVDQ